MDIGHALDREWARINGSEEARRALKRWAEQEEALVGLRDLEELWEAWCLGLRRDNCHAARSHVTGDGIVK